MSLSHFSIFNPKLSDDQAYLILNLSHGKANEMGSECLKAWEHLCEYLEAGSIRTLITTSQRKSRSGKPIFISGADVTERTGWENARVKEHVKWQRSVLQRLRKVPVFHIALVDGIAFGWGTEFLLCCDYRIATTGSTFALPETGLGILPGAGGTSELWMEIGIAHALRLGMTGERINGVEATRIGLTQENFEEWELGFKRAQQLANLTAKKSHTAIAALKSALLASRGASSAERTRLESNAYEHCVDSGEATIGRENFKKIIANEPVQWSPYQQFSS